MERARREDEFQQRMLASVGMNDPWLYFKLFEPDAMEGMQQQHDYFDPHDDDLGPQNVYQPGSVEELEAMFDEWDAMDALASIQPMH